VAYSCIDIGSNTIRLLVADDVEGQLRELMTQRAYTRIGKSLHKHSRIPADKIAESADIVATQARHAIESGAERIAIVATAAIREAPNRHEFVTAVEEAAGFPVRVLSGDEEARLSFVGATKTLGAPVGGGGVAVVDVGGGSTEIAVGTAGGVTWAETFRVGSGFLTESYLESDPPSAKELKKVRQHVEGVFEGLEPPEGDDEPLERGVAVGGSATSLRKMVGAELNHESLERGIGILESSEIAEVAQRFELDPTRVRLLPAGMIVLEAISDALGLTLTIGNGGLREGVILEMLGEQVQTGVKI
jgi:exopolyphosphatase / guanosine-5'-triphosphate,3'-diphosphate pyrophosphatase